MRMSEAPPGRCRAGLAVRSVAVGAAGARPDQVEALAVFVIEEVGKDGSGETGIVELDREILAAFVGGLGPGGADFRAADENPVRRRIFVVAGFGDDPDVLLLHRHGDDLALVFVAGLGESSDVGHDAFLQVGRTRAHRGLDGWLKAGACARCTGTAETQWRTTARRLSCLARNGRCAQGKKVGADGVAARDQAAKPSPANQGH